ncbi:peptidoglycan recognition protein [Streptomyces avermitilis]
MRGPVKTSRTRAMVPPGGTAHIAAGRDRGQGEGMRVLRSARRVGSRVRIRVRVPQVPGLGGARRSRATRPPRRPCAPWLRRTALVALACGPGLAAVLALMLCATGVDRTVAAHPAPVVGRPAPAHTTARPPIVPRSRWIDDRTLKQPPPRYDDKVVAVFVHHTDSPNTYDCADAPRIIRSLYAGQIGPRQWDDLGYNFVVDRCGTIYEGRAGGVDRPVTGAHAQGFNHRTAGIAALGTFTAGTPVPQAVTDAIAALAAWKLGLADVDPRSRVRLVSTSDHSRYAAGTIATLPVLSGHNDGFPTTCPGAALSAHLPALRQAAARLQGRR